MKRITLHMNDGMPAALGEKLRKHLLQAVASLVEPGGLLAGGTVNLEVSDVTGFLFDEGKLRNEEKFSYWTVMGDTRILDVVFGHAVMFLQAMKAETPGMALEIQNDAGDPVVYLSMSPPRKPGRPRKKALPRKEE